MHYQKMQLATQHQVTETWYCILVMVDHAWMHIYYICTLTGVSKEACTNKFHHHLCILYMILWFYIVLRTYPSASL